MISRNSSAPGLIAAGPGNPPSARSLIILSLLITALCTQFVYDLQYALIFTKRGWFNFFWYWLERFETDAAILLAAVLVALLFCPKVERVGGIAAWIARTPWLTATIVTALLGVCTLVVYKNHPLSMDEYADWFQSRVFAAGNFCGAGPPGVGRWAPA